MNITTILALPAWLLVSFAAAAIGSRYMPGRWFKQLKKPSWNPPNWVFGPVWSTLYTLMGISAWLIWREGGWAAQKLPLLIFLFQLIFNALWSWIFFGLKKPGAAFVDIVFLWITLFSMVIHFWEVRPLAGALMIPYLAWVSFASILNFSIWILNRD